MRSHRRQPTRLSCPWDSPGKNTGVGFHFLLQCMKVKSESEVAQLCPTLRDPMDWTLPGSSFHGIFPARVLEWVAIAFSSHQQRTLIKKKKKKNSRRCYLWFNLSEIFPAINTYYLWSPSSSSPLSMVNNLLTIILLKNVNNGDKISLTPLWSLSVSVKCYWELTPITPAIGLLA